MEESKTEMEKKVCILVKLIQNNNKIPKVTKKELLEVVNDLEVPLGTASSSDLDYYSCEEFDIELNEDLKRQVSNLKQETQFLRDQNLELAGDMGGKQNEDKVKFRDQKKQSSELDHLREENHTLHAIIKKQKNLSENTNLVERKMEELAQDFQMKVEDHLRILYRRIHAAEQLHLQSKEYYYAPRGDQFKKMVERGLAGAGAGPEMAINKVEQVGSRFTRLTKEIDSAKQWMHEKNKRTKHEVETLEAKLECREAQESLLKEKLSKLEAKLAEEGTGKPSLAKAMAKIKKLEINLRERDVELLSLGEEKREAIRQLCLLLDYQRSRYHHLKSSIYRLALQA